MKVFIRNTIVFVILFLVYTTCVGIFNYWNIKNLSCFKTPTAVKYLFVGDSHVQRALNDQLLEGAMNIAQPAENYILTYYKLEKALQYLKPDTVFIGFSPHNLSAFNDKKFSNHNADEFIKRSYPLFLFTIPEEIEVSRTRYFEIFMKQMLLFPIVNSCYYLGSYFNTNETHLKGLDDIIKRHFLKGNEEYEVSATSLIYLRKIITLCHSRSIEVVLLELPVHKAYQEAVPNNFKIEFANIRKQYLSEGVDIYSFQSNLADSLFLDYDHLNHKGATYYTKALKDRIDLND